MLVVSIGLADTQQQLRTALAMGADRAILVQTDAVVQPLSLREDLPPADRQGAAVAGAARQAGDRRRQQPDRRRCSPRCGTGRRRRSRSKIEVADGKATVTREVDAGLETLEVDLPAVITVDLRLNEPRYVKLPDIMKAKKKPLDTLSLGDLGVSEAPVFKVVRVRSAAAALERRDGEGRG